MTSSLRAVRPIFRGRGGPNLGHYFVSTMANANVSPFQVMKIVGHRSLDIILMYYLVRVDELLTAVSNVDLGAALGREESRKQSNFSQPRPRGFG